MTPETSTFWQWNIGQVGTAVSIFITLSLYHRNNVRRIERKAALDRDLYNKVKTVFDWVELNGADLLEMQAKVNLMYDIWFKSNSQRGLNLVKEGN